MQALDRLTACALVEAGYMPLREYIAMFGDEVRNAAARDAMQSVHLRPWRVPLHFKQPLRPSQYRVTIRSAG
jgi:hypothetical protein